MSTEYYAFLANGSIPTRDAWQSAVDTLGVPIVLDPAFTPEKASGFNPMKVGNKDAGCEIDVNTEQLPSLLDTYKVPRERIPANASVLCFRFGGDYGEGACVFAAAAALVRSYSAIFYDPQEGMLFDRPDEPIVLAREFLRKAIDA